MKTTLYLLIILYVFQSCSKCEDRPHFILDDRIKYHSRIIEEIQRYVVKDSKNFLYNRIDNYNGSTDGIESQYDNYFLTGRIESIDFGKKSKATVNVFVNNKLDKVYEGNYYQYSHSVNIDADYPGGNFNVYNNYPSVMSIPIAMCFSKKQGPNQQYSSFNSGNESDWLNKDGLIEKQIYNANLSNNDTVYLNKINWVYYPY